MTIHHAPAALMRVLNTPVEPGVSQGANRATEETPGSGAPAAARGADTEVVAHAKRRRFSNADKRRILDAADRCTQPGEIGALLRREGVYSSSLSTWRPQREAAEIAALAPQKRSPKVDPIEADARQIAQLTRENERLKNQLGKAGLVIEVQEKVAALLGSPIDDTPDEFMMAGANELAPGLGAGAAGVDPPQLRFGSGASQFL